MSTLNLEKLKILWNNRKTLPVNDKFRNRTKQLFEWVEWASAIEVPDILKSQEHTAKGDGCPTDNASQVHNALITQQGNLLAPNGIDWVGKTWNILANIQFRDEDFRTASEASPRSAYESFNTKVNQFQNTDSWFFSYNYPWHIVQWMHDTDTPSIKLEDEGDGTALNNKFILKYLWMLANPNVISILSLKSFYKLDTIFHELDGDFDEHFSYHRQNNKWQQSLGSFQEHWPSLSKEIEQKIYEKEDVSDKERRELSIFLFEISLSDNTVQDGLTMLKHGNHALILYGPPGTGKTREARILARRLLNLNDGEELPSNQVKLVQFHPGYSYQDFMGGILPKLDDNELGYKKFTGVFKKICEDAQNDPDKKAYILIIDEINRANLSAVFGELLFGLELEYRGTDIQVPWCGELINFVVPSNVYIIGTMNTTDKSLVGFDLALRRRFSFLKLMPDMTALETMPVFFRDSNMPDDGSQDKEVTSEIIKRAIALNTDLIDKLGLNKDKQIGHAYFLKLKDFCIARTKDRSNEFLVNSYALEKLWIYHLEPLLEEYLGLSFDAQEEMIKEMKENFCAPLNG